MYICTHTTSPPQATHKITRKAAPLNPNDVYQITNNVIMDTEADFLAVRNLTYHRQFHPSDPTWHYPTSTDNMIKQWHSIERVWNYMKQEDQRRQRPNDGEHSYYKRIGLFRSDLVYTDPINMQYGGDAVFPYFTTWYIHGKVDSLNDRMFYGSYENAEVWADRRFSSVPTFTAGGRQVRSESYVAWLFRDILKDFRAMCGQRIRATGQLKESDCMSHAKMRKRAARLKNIYNLTISTHDPFKCTEDQILLEKALLFYEHLAPGYSLGISTYLQQHNGCVYIDYLSGRAHNVSGEQ